VSFWTSCIIRVQFRSPEELAAVEAQIQSLLATPLAEPLLLRVQTLCLVCGIGERIAWSLVAGLAELGQTNRRQVAKLAGLAPLNADSGQWRGTRHIAFLSGGRRLVFLHGEIKHKNLWLLDLDTGAQRQLTNLPPDFDVRDFDISPDGQQVVLERAEERSDVAVLELPRQ